MIEPESPDPTNLESLRAMPLGQMTVFEVHDQMSDGDHYFSVLRVPGGWIYYRSTDGKPRWPKEDCKERLDQGVFVPDPRP